MREKEKRRRKKINNNDDDDNNNNNNETQTTTRIKRNQGKNPIEWWAESEHPGTTRKGKGGAGEGKEKGADQSVI